MLLSLMLISCAELTAFLQDNDFSNLGNVAKTLTEKDIANGLKEALNQGVSEQVSKLTAMDGFNKNDLVRIALPEELQIVDSGLRKFGMGKLADDGIVALNRAAEDAVGRSTPIFVNAITNMSFSDAKNILMGEQDSATQYLKSNTNEQLYDEFNPEIRASFDRVGANKVWSNIISKYNAIPLVKKVNPDLTDYVTSQALNGVYTMIAVEEGNIRNDFSARTSNLLKDVFALQDKK